MYITGHFFEPGKFPGVRLALTAWVIAVLIGLCALSRYTATPGPKIDANRTWPAGDLLARSTGKSTLIMTVHPQCPCSHASISELEVLMSRCHGRLSACVLFVELPGVPQDDSGLWQSASRIPNVTCIKDPAGKVSASFDAQTSGQVFVYGARGVLKFSGGITAARGHAGDNDGLTAIESIANNTVPEKSETPVFGCSLR